jgi:urea transport system ATP-binding protein
VGKTTLLKAIMGLLPIRGGEIGFDGQPLAKRPAQARAGHGIGYVPQGREIFPRLTVEENLGAGLFARQERLKKIPEEIFQLFPVLKKMLRRRGKELSGGRALAIDPKMLILDEPTAGIQPNIIQEIGDIILH